MHFDKQIHVRKMWFLTMVIMNRVSLSSSINWFFSKVKLRSEIRMRDNLTKDDSSTGKFKRLKWCRWSKAKQWTKNTWNWCQVLFGHAFYICVDWTFGRETTTPIKHYWHVLRDNQRMSCSDFYYFQILKS